ncbi:DnaD domain-containing protein [Staphylococcus sp. 17KM0847]|uniref:DnaD domain-containing protein n=1 Tax=Staphylococcus sp. 17KM0847 TaxID=2583989 RepID=UPI0015DC5646|nr:DnaD domain-containing protein [Staphylococcus sp. 17KM0847]QLK86158.1 DnaD domain-containing protein [Staphylococcus sp. 17KM0847]
MNIEELQKRPFVCRYELLEHYEQLGLNEADLIILMKLLYTYESNHEQPAIEVLQHGTTMQSKEITMIIQKLVQLGLLNMHVEKNADGKFAEYMDLHGFYEQFTQLLKNISTQRIQQDKDQTFQQLFQKIEQGFGRGLSPVEIEHLNQWIDVDKYDLALINAAVDEAFAHHKSSLKYIDRILLNWEKNNVRTVEDSKPIRAQFNQSTHHPTKKIENFPKFDWLKGENPFAE